MIKLSLAAEGRQVIRTLEKFARQQDFAAALALTRTAQIVKASEEHEMRDVFDRPTPWTMNSLFLKPATRVRMEASVGLKDFAGKGIPASKFLAPQIEGGQRREKRFERALRYAGVLPHGYLAVPASGARFDAYGNMSRGQIVQILSYFQAFSESGYRANTTDKRRQSLARGTRKRMGVSYFAGRPGGGRLPLGVWQRVHSAFGTAIRPVLLFVRDTVSYEKTFDFEYVGLTTANRELPLQLDRALQDAWDTAR